MDWLTPLLKPDVIAVLIPVISVIVVFAYLGLKAYFRHAERMEKIRHGIDPDANDSEPIN